MKTFLLLVFLTLFSWNAMAAVAVVSGLKGKASLLRAGQTLPLTLNAQIEKNDRLQTTANTRVQLTFNDRTIITVGQNSQFEINDFLQDTASNSKFQATLSHGFMRTMSGKIGKLAPERFKIKTKTATIGIRGTIFTVQTNETTTTVATLSGETYLQVNETGQTFNVPQNRQATYNNQTNKVTEAPVQSSSTTDGSQDDGNSPSEGDSDNSQNDNTSNSEDNTNTDQNTADESSNNDNAPLSALTENSQSDVDQATQSTEQAAQNANQNTLDDNLSAEQGNSQSVNLPQTNLLSTLSEAERADFAASGNPLLKQAEQDQLTQTDSPYAFGYWLDSNNDSIEGFWAEGTLTQNTLDTIANAHTQNITATYSATYDGGQMSLAAPNYYVSSASLDVTVQFGTGQVTTDFNYALDSGPTGSLTGSSTDLNNLLNNGHFKVDNLVESTPTPGVNVSGQIDGQLVGTDQNGVPGGVTGTLSVEVSDPQNGNYNIQGSYGTSTVSVSSP